MRTREFVKNKLALASSVFIAAITLCAVFAPMLTTYGVSDIDSSSVLCAPSGGHLFGTDMLGRDVFTRILYGARISLMVGLVAVGIAFLVGILLGSAAGYYGGKLDYTIMRFVDIMLCFPSLFLILAVIAFLEPSIFNIMAVIGLTSWMGVARLIRAEILTLKERDFVAAAKVMGARNHWIILRHIIPNAIGPVLVNAALGMGMAILIESSLSFLGIGVQPPTPSWGNMLIDGKATLGFAWWLTVFPGLFIMFTVLSFNLLGETLRDG